MHGSTFGLGSLYHNGLRHFESEQNLFCSDFFERVFIYPTCVVIFSCSVRPSPAFQGRRAITPNESSFLAGVPLRMFKSVFEF